MNYYYWRAACTAPKAMTTPKPPSRFHAGPIVGNAVFSRMFLTWVLVRLGLADHTKAAIAAACGAAADVPKNGSQVGV
jgi:hypothetical protein